MKLELNHLAPYLPYGLSLQTPDNISEMVSIIGCDPFFEIKDYTSEDEVLLRVASNDFCDFATWGISQIKPLLRPLSDYLDINSEAMNNLNTDCQRVINLKQSECLNNIITRNYPKSKTAKINNRRID